MIEAATSTHGHFVEQAKTWCCLASVQQPDDIKHGVKNGSNDDETTRDHRRWMVDGVAWNGLVCTNTLSEKVQAEMTDSLGFGSSGNARDQLVCGCGHA
jgi:hypothetical protein